MTIITYTVHLGCPCASALGWSEEWEAETPEEAAERAVERAMTCCRCGSVTAQCGEHVAERRETTETEKARQ